MNVFGDKSQGWGNIFQYNSTPDDVFIDTSWPLMMYQTIHADPWQCIVYWIPHVWEIQYTICFPHNRKPNNQDIILIYGMFYWSQYCKDYDNFSKVKCCYFLVTFLRKRPKIHKNGNDIGLSLLCECDIEIIAAQVLQYRESSHKTSSHKTNFSIRRFWLI